MSNDQLLIQNVSRPLLSPIPEETVSNKLDDIDYDVIMTTALSSTPIGRMVTINSDCSVPDSVPNDQTSNLMDSGYSETFSSGELYILS